MPAAFHGDLVLEVTAGSPRARELADCAADHECTAEARVGIDEQRQRRRRRDAAHVLAHVAQRRHREVRQPERGVGDAGARQVDGPETRFLGEHCGIGVDRADDLQRAFRLKCGAESGSCTHSSCPPVWLLL